MPTNFALKRSLFPSLRRGREQRVRDRFLQAGAVSQATARRRSELLIDRDGTWFRLRDRGRIRQAEPGYYYFSEAEHEPFYFPDRYARVAGLIVAAGLVALGVQRVMRR